MEHIGVADSWIRIRFATSGECEKGGSNEAKLLPFLVIVWIVCSVKLSGDGIRWCDPKSLSCSEQFLSIGVRFGIQLFMKFPLSFERKHL